MATPPIEKSTPDIQKLQSMGSRTISVVKLLSRTGAGMPIIVGKKGVSLDEITGLHTTLPVQPGAGPGTYKFEVFDETGPEKDVWTAKLGPEMEALPMSEPQGLAAGMSPPGAPRHLGGGWFYDDTTGLLISPTKQAMPWKPGEPFPGQIPAPAAAATPVAASAWTPWGPQPAGAGAPPPWMWGGAGGGMPGWGQIPATGEDDTKRELREMKATLEARNREDAHKAEMAALAKSVEEQGKRFEALVAKLVEKPSGPSPEVVALTAQLEEVKRQNAEATARTESARREDALRAEIKAQGDRFEALARDMKADKPDAMLTMVTNMLGSMQASTTAMVNAMQSTAQAQASSAENGMRELAARLGTSAMTPERVLELLRVAKDQTPATEMNKGVMDMYKTLFSMSQEVLRTQAEMSGAANGPAWLPPVQQALEQVGTIARAVAEKRAGADAQSEMEKQRAVRVGAEAVVATEKRRTAEAEAATAQAHARVAQAQAAAHAPAAPGTKPQAPDPVAVARAAGREPTAAEIRDSAARSVFKPANGAAAAAAPAPVPPVTQAAPKKKRAAAAAAAAAPAEAEQPSAPVNLAATPSDEVRATVADLTDDQLFGPAYSQIVKLRGAAENGMPAADAAEAILMSRQYFRSFGELPPAMELLNAGQLEVLCERIFPGEGAVVGYRKQVADQIRIKARAEAAEGGDDIGLTPGDDDGGADGESEAVATA